MKKYKTWWLIVASVAGFIWFNWTLYALTGMNLILPFSDSQGFIQAIVGVFSSLVTGLPLIDGTHKESETK